MKTKYDDMNLIVVTQHPSSLCFFDENEHSDLVEIYKNVSGAKDLMSPALSERLRLLSEARSIGEPCEGMRALNVKEHKLYIWTGLQWVEQIGL